MSYSSWGCKESEVTEQLSAHVHRYTHTHTHTHRTHTHTHHTHTPFSHYDHCSHTMTTKWHEGSASSTSPRSPELEHTRSQGAPWQQGGWAQVHCQRCREGRGAAKKSTIECAVQEKAGCAHSSGPLSNTTLQGTGSQSNQPV